MLFYKLIIKISLIKNKIDLNNILSKLSLYFNKCQNITKLKVLNTTVINITKK